MREKFKIALLLGLVLISTSVGWAQESKKRSLSSTEKRQQADAEMEKGRELLKQGYFDSAVVKYQDAFKIAPNYPAPYEELGKMMLEKRNFAYAIEMYSKLVELEPKNSDYHKVLFNLAEAYNSPTQALKSGQALVSMNEADPETLKKMAELYGQLDLPYERAKTMELYARETDADAEYWNSIALLYLNQNKPYLAEDAVKVAIEKEPSSTKYKSTLGRVYSNSNRLAAAEVVFNELLEESPEDQGLKDELGQIYAQQGDAYLSRGRANTALKYYDKAEATGLTEAEEATAPGAGVYKGTINTPNQVFNTNSSTTGMGVGSYRRGAGNFNTIGGSLAERRATANQLLRPQYLFDADFGHQDVNSYTLLDNVVRVPLRGTELDLRVRHSYREVSSFAGSAGREYLYAGMNYNWNKNWSTEAYVGSKGLYDITTLYEGDKFRGGLLVQRDVWSYTPRALGTDLYFNRQSLFGGVSLGERWSIGGNVDLYQFNDGIDQTTYSIGPAYQLIYEPGVQELQVSYAHSGQTNSRTIDPIVRYSPSNLSADSIGLEYNRVINDRWRLNAGYYYTWSRDSIDGHDSGGSWNLGSDFQLWKGAWLGVNYERGSFGQGVISPNIQSINNSKNDNLNVNFGVTF